MRDVRNRTIRTKWLDEAISVSKLVSQRQKINKYLVTNTNAKNMQILNKNPTQKHAAKSKE